MDLLHSFDTLDAVALRGTSSLLLLAGLLRWLLAEGKVTLKHHREAQAELQRQKERNQRHATQHHQTGH